VTSAGARIADSPDDAPYNGSDQNTTRARIQLDYNVNEWASAFVEFNFSEVWAGSEPYSDAQPFQNDPDGLASRENFNGVSQAYMQLDNAFGFEERIRIGRSYYFLGNGLVLGSCDYLQYPGSFTGIWISRSFGQFDVELFAFDNYGPLQNQIAGGGERYAGATTRWNIEEGGAFETLDAYYLAGTGDGDNEQRADDDWVGVEAAGWLPADIRWEAQFANRSVDGGDDVSGYRAMIEHSYDEPIFGFIHGVSFTHTGAEGPLHINPADFNAAGLLHQYGGPWRSDLTTNQLALKFSPGADINCTLAFLTLDRGDGIPQQGEFEVDLLASKEVRQGFHVGLGYAIDDEERQVGFGQATLYF